MKEPDYTDPHIGEMAGIYEIKTKLNEGGMGALYVAQHPELGSKAAVKVILARLVNSINHKMFVDRFFNEAKAAAALCTEWKRFDDKCNLVNVTHCGYLENGSPFMVLDYLDGDDLSQWLRKKQEQGTHVDFADVLSILAQTCCGLEAVHQAKIVHRDLSLGNLFLTPTFANPLQLKILDFGIAKLSESSIGQSEKTWAQAFLGKHEYASPEQVRQSASVDARADIYSLGVIAYRILCYRKPYKPTIVDGPQGRALERPPIPHPCTLRPEVPKPWGDLVMQMMAEDPNDRPSSALAIAHLLARTLPDEFGDGPAILEKVAPLLTVREWLDRSRKMLRPFPLKEIDTSADTKKTPKKGGTKTYSAQGVPSMPQTLTTLESAASEKAPSDELATLPPTIPKPLPPKTYRSRSKAPLLAGLGTAILAVATIAVVGLLRDGKSTKPTGGATAIEHLDASSPEAIDAGTKALEAAELADAAPRKIKPAKDTRKTERQEKPTPAEKPKPIKKTPTKPKTTPEKPPSADKTKPLGPGLLD